MNAVQRIPKTDLARNTRSVINAVLRGQPAVVESYGEPEVAIIDIIDYHIIRAAMRYYAHLAEIRQKIDVEVGLSNEEIAKLSDLQSRYDRTLAHYLAGSISLSRAAELLGLSWFDLRTRCLRLDIPLRAAPANVSEAQADVKVAEEWTTEPRQ